MGNDNLLYPRTKGKIVPVSDGDIAENQRKLNDLLKKVQLMSHKQKSILLERGLFDGQRRKGIS
jgi:hypothetical protein